MSGPHPGNCPACGGPKHSYAVLCHFCDIVDENHYLTAELRISIIPSINEARRLAWQEGLGPHE